MKIKKLFFVSVMLLYVAFIYGQNDCKVLLPEISETYVGKCKKGLAHGKGEAKGVDTYKGRFKSGLPDGYGKYTYSNGVIYEGFWEKGKRHGEGKLYFNIKGIDSIKHGIWKEDRFVRRIEPNPYQVLRSVNVTRYSVRRVKDGNKVVFAFLQNGTTNSGIYNFSIFQSSGMSFAIGDKPGFDGVLFPFTCNIYYSSTNSMRTARMNVEFEILITEPGEWEVTVHN